MKFSTPLLEGHLKRRYRRFLADVKLPDGSIITAHCPTSAVLSGCQTPGSKIYLSQVENPLRKLSYTWEITQVGRTKICINPNHLGPVVSEAIKKEKLAEIKGFAEQKRFVQAGQNGKVNFLLFDGSRQCHLEVRNVTLARKGTALFPDSIQKNGNDHIQDLMRHNENGHRTILLFIVPRSDCEILRIAQDIDPHYSKSLKDAVGKGLEILAYRAKVTAKEIILRENLPVEI
jgi:sugar fermentation stimulation protein A